MNDAVYSAYSQALSSARALTFGGHVTDVIGFLIESSGPKAKMGEICRLLPASGAGLLGEVVGFRDGKVLIMPYGDLDGIEPGSPVFGTGKELRVPVGDEMLGRIVDCLGRPIDGRPLWPVSLHKPAMAEAPGPMQRCRISSPFETGIKAIDGLLTLGCGQRIGIFSGSGVGKSTLMGMIARNTSGEVNVIALVGERGREVKEFVERDLGAEGLKRSVLVVSTSDQPAVTRIKAAWVATTIAEYFRDKGLSVLLMMDSVTRWCMALREVGLAIGEPPTTRGYTPSVFANLPKLLERAGTGASGSITGIYTVLVEGDDMDEPIADAARGILDGHIVLSRELANMGHYPSIDILQSVSRLSTEVAGETQLENGLMARDILATYRKAEDLVNIGAYVKGSSPKIDNAIARIDKIYGFLRQGIFQKFSMEESQKLLASVFQEIVLEGAEKIS